ncbi:MAG: alpha-L-fucosidase [Kiritimatiellaeota bacterium]|nr:alpha-L-fucosidase [Kiritimatiellota bacterium]
MKSSQQFSSHWKVPQRVMNKIGLVALVFSGPFVRAESFVPDGRVRPDDYTVLMAVDAPRPADCKPFQAGSHGKFFVNGWTRLEQKFVWDVVVPSDDDYAVNLLARRQNGAPLDIVVACGEQSVTGKFTAAVQAWERQALDGKLKLTAGKHTLTLASRGTNYSAAVMSIELVRPAVRERLHATALNMRADTIWFRQARYGLMCHWTSQSFPRHGPRKPYAAAVQAFDVQGFADQVQATGAGFLVLTTSHAEMFFPAPIQALERILPGRTTERDLIDALATALGKRGIRLLLYYHLGASNDPAWLRASGFWETDTRKFFANWMSVVGEIGERYRDKLAGWWFDDGATSYYYRSAPWEQLTRAAKAGNPQRLVGYNPWELPVPTAFQDFHCGEGFREPGDSRSQRDGLQACATLVTEGDWGHFRPEREIGRPRWTADQMAQNIQQFAARKVVPIFNVEIYQDGTLSPHTVEMFQAARRNRK